MSINQFRAQMNVTKEWIYFNHASVGPLPKETFLSQLETINNKMYHGSMKENFNSLDRDFEELQQVAGKIIGTKDWKNIFFPSSTHQGIITIIEGLPLKEEGNIVITDMEFTQNSYPYQVLAGRTGRELRVVENIDGRLPIEKYEEKIDENTRLVAVSHVQFSNGFMTDLKKLSELIHENGGFLLVDAIQSLGSLEFKADSWGVDGVVAGGYKWLLGPFMTGIGFVSKEWIDRLNPIVAAWLSDKEYLNMRHHPYNPLKGGRRLQPHINEMTFTLKPSLDLLTKIGLGQIRKQTLKIGSEIIKRAEELGFEIGSPMNDKERGAIVKINVPNASKTVEKLKKERIAVSYREGGVRFSPHGYNTIEEVDTIFSKIEEIIKRE